MATLTKGTTFASGDVVTPAKLNNLVDAATVSNIVNADIGTSAAISLSKLATGALPSAITIASDNIVAGTIATIDIADSAITSAKIADSAITSAKIADSAITSAKIVDGTIANADISASAAISHSKLASISSGQVLLGNASNIPTATTLTGDVTINSSGATAIGSGVIDNANINASAGIADSKLAAITSTGKVANSATTAASSNTANAIVVRDASGNFSAGTITASISGNSSTATTWADSRNLSLTGDVTATFSSVNGSANVSAAATIANLAVTTGKIANAAVTTDKIADADVTTAKIADANVTTGKIANAAVTTDKIADADVTTAKIADANVTTGKIANGSVTAAKLGTNEQKQIAKAWVNFNGTLATPITPRASYNVSSVTKTGTGDYTINFTVAVADVNYSIVGTSTQDTALQRAITINEPNPVDRTKSSCKIFSTYYEATKFDANTICLTVFGN